MTSWSWQDIDCKMQFGGNDQRSNIISGVDLTRREVGKQVYGMTFALLTTSEGVKMARLKKVPCGWILKDLSL